MFSTIKNVSKPSSDIRDVLRKLKIADAYEDFSSEANRTDNRLVAPAAIASAIADLESICVNLPLSIAANEDSRDVNGNGATRRARH